MMVVAKERDPSKTGRNAKNLRPSGYGTFAHQRDRELLARSLNLLPQYDEKGRLATNFHGNANCSPLRLKAKCLRYKF